MSDDTNSKETKMARAAELDAAIKAADKKRADDEGNLNKLLTALDGLMGGMDTLRQRMDALESGHLKMHGGAHRGERVVPTDGEPQGGPGRSPISDDHGKTREPGEPHPTAADSAADPNDANNAIFGHGRKFQPMFYEHQSMADTAWRAWSGAAPPPLSGERLLDFRRRLLRPLMKHSTQFSSVDVDELHEPLITPIEKSVFSDAIQASTDNSSVPEDFLREIVTVDKTGRRISSFIGQPRSWMKEFAGQRRRLIGIRNTTLP
jgi:hypothetical protein